MRDAPPRRRLPIHRSVAQVKHLAYGEALSASEPRPDEQLLIYWTILEKSRLRGIFTFLTSLLTTDKVLRC